jgi:hypothetical protein
MRFEVVGPIVEVETIAQGSGIREIDLLRHWFGLVNWRKKKGIAKVQLADGTTARAETHWYEAHGIGKVLLKTKEWRWNSWTACRARDSARFLLMT